MEQHDLPGLGELHDAAAVRSSRRKIDEAIRALAARPLDEAAADQMRQTLAATEQGRAALKRLDRAASWTARPGRTVRPTKDGQ